jgi:5-methylcytosine-specific restriction endonuclease McrA
MQINNIQRPWQKKTSYGNRLTKDPFYQSSEWKRTKASFKLGQSILPNGKPVSNMLCYECMAKDNRPTPGHSIDHIVPIEEGGSRTDHNNLMNLCLSHHNSKSAKEGNKRRKK